MLLSDLGIRQIKVVFDPLGHFPLFAKSFTATIISSFKQSQQNLIKLKLKPYGTGLFELAQLQTAFLTSSFESHLPTSRCHH